MGAAYDAMCKNEGLQSTLSNRNRKIREQKKLIIELCSDIKELMEDNENFNPKNSNEYPLYNKVTKILNKLNNKNKK